MTVRRCCTIAVCRYLPPIQNVGFFRIHPWTDHGGVCETQRLDDMVLSSRVVSSMALFLLLSLCCCRLSIVTAMPQEHPHDEDSNDSSSRQTRRTFRSGNVAVHVVPNFLPLELAMKWRDTMTREWDARFQCSTNNDNNNNAETTGWRYATNNNGTFRGTRAGAGVNNAKVRSLDQIAARNVTAQQMKQANQFSYAKWELDPHHELVQEMEQTFLSKEIRDKVTEILSQMTNENENVDLAAQELSDLFVTLYSTGDFLSTHNDGVSGTFAFVVSLMDAGPSNHQWQDDFGGALAFQCEGAPSEGWCEVLNPTFNTAIFFQTMSNNGGSVGPHHQVLPVTYRAELEGFRRFGLTGWYMDRKNVMSDNARAERDKMRGK